jgi:single-strand DNA-binding protein
MRSKNAVSLIGHLGKKPELQKTPKTGTPFTRLSLACNYSYRSGDEIVQGVDWVPLKVYGKLAENAVKYLDKGSHVAVEARLKSWQSNKNGSTRYGMDVVANDILFLDAKEQAASPEEQNPTPGHGEAPAVDEDIPF